MTFKQEMARYRNRVTARKGGKRGRRRSDAVVPPMFGKGILIQVVIILLMGLFLLTACTKAAI